MRLLIVRAIEAVRGGFWALPLACMAFAVVAATITASLDARFLEDASSSGLPPWMLTPTPDTVRSVLTIVGSGMLGVLGIAFSVTITALVLASQQFGPHVLRSFMERRFVQVVLGAFGGTALYCMISLHLSAATAAGDDGGAVFTVHTALAAGVVDLVLLIFFIHGTADSLRADTIIDAIHEEFLGRADALFPPTRVGADLPHDAASVALPLDGFADAPASYRVPSSGYLQELDHAALIAFARTHSLVLRVRHLAGDPLLAGNVLVDILPVPTLAKAGDGPVEPIAAGTPPSLPDMETLDRELDRRLVIGREPTPSQDPRFAIRQLVQIALRALSPALNDPFTAMTCIDRLASIVSVLLERPPRGGWSVDVEGRPRLLEPTVPHAELIAFAFDAIRIAGDGRADIARHLLATFDALIERHPDGELAALLDRPRARRAEGADGDTVSNDRHDVPNALA